MNASSAYGQNLPRRPIGPEDVLARRRGGGASCYGPLVDSPDSTTFVSADEASVLVVHECPLINDPAALPGLAAGCRQQCRAGR